MTPTDEQLAFLNRLLKLLANDHVAAVDPENPESVTITYQMGSFPNRVPSHLTVDRSEDGDDLWCVNAISSSGGTRDYPPDVDVCEVNPPSSWEVTSTSVVRLLLIHAIQDVCDAMNDAKLAEDLEKAEAFEYDPAACDDEG